MFCNTASRTNVKLLLRIGVSWEDASFTSSRCGSLMFQFFGQLAAGPRRISLPPGPVHSSTAS
jgi:hypothetical protein